MTLAREHLLTIYHAALDAVQGEARTQKVLAEMAWAERLSSSGTSSAPVAVIAIGKAAASMMQGAVAVLGEHLCAGLVISKQGHATDARFADHNIVLMAAGHPLPDDRSLRAGQHLLSFLNRQTAQTRFVFLISGGASSLVEVLPQGMRLEDLQRLNDWLLSSGWDIKKMNRLRATFSCIKGGRLARFLKGRQTQCLMMSDVPGDYPHIIGSGLLFADPSQCCSDKKQMLKQNTVMSSHEWPSWITRLPTAPPAPDSDDVCFESITARIIASLAEAKQAAANAARTLGYAVIQHDEMVTGDAQTRGQQLAQQLCDSPVGRESVVHIWGGETTVKLPAQAGRGGRNQHLALAAATVLAGQRQHYFLAAGTDGTDGPTQDAGALVDAATIERGEQCGFDASQTLHQADAGHFLAASNDLIRTGPTGTNVMDLMLGLKLSGDK